MIFAMFVRIVDIFDVLLLGSRLKETDSTPTSVDVTVTRSLHRQLVVRVIVLQCGYHYISMFLTIYQPPDLTTEPATWHFNTPPPGAGSIRL
jgi:hypothetical protein